MWRAISFLLISLCGCVSHAPMDVYQPTRNDLLPVATLMNITDDNAPVHFYIEGDGHAFDAAGHPTADPTPRGNFMRNLANVDTSPNVVYMARPCQFEMNAACTVSDWTDGRFAPRIIDSMAAAVRHIAGARPVVLVGYSGGAMASGLIIQNHPEINVVQWVTIAGVLNHADWTAYFGDSPLSHSMNMNNLPRVPQTHYAAENDKTVPIELSRKWVGEKNLHVVPDATHDDFGNFKLGL